MCERRGSGFKPGANFRIRIQIQSIWIHNSAPNYIIYGHLSTDDISATCLLCLVPTFCQIKMWTFLQAQGDLQARKICRSRKLLGGASVVNPE